MTDHPKEHDPDVNLPPGGPENLSPAEEDDSVPPIDLRNPTIPPEGDSEEAEGGADAMTNEYSRYEEFRVIGVGGTAVVRSCIDPHLGRRVALKELHPNLNAQLEQHVRFIREARVMAQLEHPNIVPVHELGVHEDDGVYFTMKRIRGLTLKEILDGLERNREDLVEEYTLFRLLDILVDVCQAIAFAHTRGVVHRDLKPANILVGQFGEVLVLDWGLAKILGMSDKDSETPPGGLTPTSELDIATRTMEGSVSGTPLYMSPEQARGEVTDLDERSDVYSLGAILYEMLTYTYTIQCIKLDELITQVSEGTILPPREMAPERRIPKELDAICMKALAKDREQRYRRVTELIEDIRNFREGRSVSAYPEPLLRRAWKWCRRHPVASSTTAAGLAVALLGTGLFLLVRGVQHWTLMSGADGHHETGARLYAETVEQYQDLEQLRAARIRRRKSPEERDLEERVDEQYRQAENHYDTAVMLALMAPGKYANRHRRQLIGDIFADRLAFDLMTGDYAKGEQRLNFIRLWLGKDFELAEPEWRAEFMELADRLKGDGTLTVSSDPVGAQVALSALRPGGDGLLAPTLTRSLGGTPVAGFALPKGSYLLTLTHPARPLVRCPVWIEHGEVDSVEVVLPAEIPEGMVYVPAGLFYTGGPNARFQRLLRKNLPGFFIKEREVTFGEYLEYWLDPEGGARSGEDRARIRFDQDIQAFEDAWDDAGVLAPPVRVELPVVGVTQSAATRYCEWLGRKTGGAVRLPTAAEWEKAARGVDARDFVWGNHYDPELAFTVENTRAAARFGFWAPPGLFPADRSVYGAWDLAGNVREWTSSRFTEGSPFFQVKGASASTTKPFLYCAYSSDTPVVPSDIGFRYVIPLDGADEAKE